MSKLKLDYMPSGFCGGGIRLESVLSKASEKNRAGYINFMADWFNDMRDKYLAGIQLMFNPVSDTEKNIELFINEIRPKITKGIDLYADSGGLQLSRGTLNSKNKDLNQIKEGVYNLMVKYADYGMCFDYLPIKPPETTNQSDYQNLIVVEAMVETCGRDTGREIKKQIEYFKKYDSKVKILAILQGYNLDQKCRFAEQLYAQLSEEDYGFISGISPAAMSAMELLNGYDIYYELDKLPVPEEHLKNVHFLGLASMIKLAPVFTAIKHNKNLLFPKIEKFTADSTTFTCSEYMGKFQDVQRYHSTYTLGRTVNKTTYEMLNRRFEFFKDRFKKFLDVDLTYKEYLNKYTVYRGDGLHLIDSFEGSDDDFAAYTFRYFLSFADETSKFLESMQNYEKFYTHKVYGPILEILDKMNTKDDYFYYRPYLQKILGANKPRSMYSYKIINTLDEDVLDGHSLDSLF